MDDDQPWFGCPTMLLPSPALLSVTVMVWRNCPRPSLLRVGVAMMPWSEGYSLQLSAQTEISAKVSVVSHPCAIVQKQRCAWIVT